MKRKSSSIFIVWRKLSRRECPWLERDCHPVEVFYLYEGPTHGCVSSFGLAVTEVYGETPFLEIPKNALLKLW